MMGTERWNGLDIIRPISDGDQRTGMQHDA